MFVVGKRHISALSMIWAYDCVDLSNLHFLMAAEATHDAGM